MYLIQVYRGVRSLLVAFNVYLQLNTVEDDQRLEASKASVHVSYDRTLLEPVILHLVNLVHYH